MWITLPLTIDKIYEQIEISILSGFKVFHMEMLKKKK